MKYLGFVLETPLKTFDFAGPLALDGKDIWVFFFPRTKGKKVVGYDVRYTESKEEFEKEIGRNSQQTGGK